MFKQKYIKNLLRWLLMIVISIGLAIVLRVFVIAKFMIPTPSMEPAIAVGDQILVSKLTPGPRLIKNLFSLQENEKPEISRFQVSKIKRNDILVFNFPYFKRKKLGFDYRVYYTKRCIGIPRDSLDIVNGFYKVRHQVDTLGDYYNQEKLSRRNQKEIKEELYQSFPNDKNYSWNIKNFGPLYIPGKGDCLSIDSMSIILYQQLIEYETGKTIGMQRQHVLLNDSIITSYTFQSNYYFMAGDYVQDSKDSRYWGLLPEDHIVGKAVLVLSNKDPKTGKTNWKRFLRKIK